MVSVGVPVPQQETPIAEAICLCSKSVSELRELIDSLYSRLSPILAEPSPGDDVAGDIPIAGSPLLCELIRHRKDVQACKESIAEIIERLEV